MIASEPSHGFRYKGCLRRAGQMVYFYFGEDLPGTKAIYFCPGQYKNKNVYDVKLCQARAGGKKILAFLSRQYVNDAL